MSFAGTRATRPGEPVPHSEARPWEAAILLCSRASPTAPVPQSWRRAVTFPAVPPSGTPSPHVGVSSDSLPLAVPLAGFVLLVHSWYQLFDRSASRLTRLCSWCFACPQGRSFRIFSSPGGASQDSGCMALYGSLHSAPDTSVPSCVPRPSGGHHHPASC